MVHQTNISLATATRLQKMPGPGGTHMWLAQVAGGLKRVLPAEACAAFLQECCERWVTHRVVPRREILDAVHFAYDGEATVGHQGRRWPAADAAAITRALAADGAAVCDGVTDTGMTAAEALTHLFRPGEWACGGWSCERPVVRRLEEWLENAADAQFVCPNPVRGAEPVSCKAGRPSLRCQANVAMRRWIVAEFDDATKSKAEQAKLVTTLARALPLGMLVDSGGKSLHGWFYCEGFAEGDVDRFFRVACVLGADPSRWDPCGWVRMPGGLRRKTDGTTVRQKIVFARGEVPIGY
jgi:hypothetical protein